MLLETLEVNTFTKIPQMGKFSNRHWLIRKCKNGIFFYFLIYFQSDTVYIYLSDEFHNETYPGPAFDIAKYVKCLPYRYNMQDCSTSYRMEGILFQEMYTSSVIEGLWL